TIRRLLQGQQRSGEGDYGSPGMADRSRAGWLGHARTAQLSPRHTVKPPLRLLVIARTCTLMCRLAVRARRGAAWGHEKYIVSPTPVVRFHAARVAGRDGHHRPARRLRGPALLRTGR